MKLVPFDKVRHALLAGVPLPWSVRNAAGELLLAKGTVITDPSMLADLIERGAFVDAADIAASAHDDAPTGSQASQWSQMEARLGILLRSPTERSFLQRVRESLGHLAAIASGHLDQLIFLVLRHDFAQLSNYGVAHALHVSALAGLLARRLGWSNGRCTSVMGAALTMNVSILDLQGSLAASPIRPTPSERAKIDAHPMAAAHVLRAAGLTDEEWLQAVEQHHEAPGGTGYPRGMGEPCEAAQLLRLVDIFTAKHSPRASREPMPAQQAARELSCRAVATWRRAC